MSASQRPLRVFLVAGESSGDALGAALISALRARKGDALDIRGVGGPAMQHEGLASLFPMSDLSVMGVVPVLQRLPLLLRRIRETVVAIGASQPDVVVLIDSPDFCRRVARRVRRQWPNIALVKYVSPTVWAWRPGRARAMRPHTDHLLALLPFEPAAHLRLGGPPATYVGHPLMRALHRLKPNREERLLRAEVPGQLLVLPGSRRSEVRRLMPEFGAVVARLASEFPGLSIVLPIVPHVRGDVEAGLEAWPVRPRLVESEAEKWAAFRSARAALAASGTVTLELALAEVPMVVAYKLRWLEAAVARRLITVRTPVLPDLILGRHDIPVFMQEFCTTDAIVDALRPLIAGGAARETQLQRFSAVEDAMRLPNDAAPADVAAEIVLTMAR